MGKHENDLAKATIEYVTLKGGMAWRNNTGRLFDRTGRPVRYGCVGSGDVLACIRGRFVSIELKKPGGRVTVQQRDWIASVNEAGGFAFTAYEIDYIMATVDKLFDDGGAVADTLGQAESADGGQSYGKTV